MDINSLYENSKKNIIGKDKKQKLVKKIKSVATTTLVALIAITSGVSLTACTDPNTVNRIVSVYVFDAQEIYEKYNMSPTERHSVEEYSKIPDINDENLIGFYEMRDRIECDKIAQALGYDNLDDYLVKNGYVNSEGGPSIKAWREYYADKAMGGTKQK